MTKKRMKEILRNKNDVIYWQTELIKQLKKELEVSNAEVRSVKADLVFAEYRISEFQKAVQAFGG